MEKATKCKTQAELWEATVIALLGAAVLVVYSPQKQLGSAGDSVPHQPIRAAEAGLLVAGPSTGLQICDTGFIYG